MDLLFPLALYYRLVVIAVIKQRTDLAFGFASVADLATEPDDIEVGGVVGIFGELCCQVLMRFVGVHLRRAQSQPARDPVDVGVDRESRHAQREQQDDGGRLKADAFKLHQPVHRLLRIHFFKEIQVELPALLGDLAQGVLNARTLLVGQPGDADGLDDLGLLGIPHSLPGGEAGSQAIEGFIPVNVIGVLRQDRGDEFVDRRQRVAPFRLAVEVQQGAVEFQGALGVEIWIVGQRFHPSLKLSSKTGCPSPTSRSR